MSDPILETRSLTVSFGGVKAVNAVDFKLSRGELRCLIGPNGAGKSTFFKAITGQLRPTSGHALYRGRTIDGLQPHQIARLGLGIKTQVPAIFDGLSARENIWIAASRRHSGNALEEAVDLQIEQVGIGAFQHRRAAELAHGQRQLVELGMVLAPQPELVLLDEPAAGMARHETERLAEIIREINKAHSIIVVEHDMQFIQSIASTVTVLNQGALLIEGPAADVLADRTVRDVYLGKQVTA